MNKRTSKVSKDTFKPGQYMSHDALQLFQFLVARHEKYLEKKHWDTLRFMKDETKKGKDAQFKILSEMQAESRLIDNALNELTDLWISQFPKGREELTARLKK